MFKLSGPCRWKWATLALRSLSRLEARDGDLALKLNSGNEPLRQDLESGVGSLVNALKDEQIQVSNVEVSKSPINKVRRMKEAR